MQVCMRRIGEPVAGVGLQGAQLPRHPRKVAGYVPRYVLRGFYGSQLVREHGRKLLLALQGGIPPADLLSPLLEFPVAGCYDALQIGDLLAEGIHELRMVVRSVLTLRCRVRVRSCLVRVE